MSEEKVTEKLRNPLTLRAFFIGLNLCIFGYLISAFGLAFTPYISVATTLGGGTSIIIMVILSLIVTLY